MLLEELRDKSEIIEYFKAQNVNITDEDIEQLKEQYKDISLDVNNLTLEQLSKVAGGGPHLVIKERIEQTGYGMPHTISAQHIGMSRLEHIGELPDVTRKITSDKENGLDIVPDGIRDNVLSSATVKVETHIDTNGIPIVSRNEISLAALAYREDLSEIRATTLRSLSGLKIVAKDDVNNSTFSQTPSYTKALVAKEDSSFSTAISINETKGSSILDNVHTRLVRALTETLTHEKKQSYETGHYRMNDMDTFFHKMTFDETGEIIHYAIPKEGESQNFAIPGNQDDYITFAEYVMKSKDITWQQKLLYLFYPDGELLKLKPWAKDLLKKEHRIREELAEVFKNMAKEEQFFDPKCRYISCTIKDGTEDMLRIGITTGTGASTITNFIDVSLEDLDYNFVTKEAFGVENFEAFGKYTRLIQEAIEKIKGMAIETAKEKVIEYLKMAGKALAAIAIPAVLAAFGIKLSTNSNKNDDGKK